MKFSQCFEKSFHTHAMIAGTYYDDVVVVADLDDCKYGQCATVCSVLVDGENVIDIMFISELDSLSDRVFELAQDRFNSRREQRTEKKAEIALETRREEMEWNAKRLWR